MSPAIQQRPPASPDYVELVRYLIEPFLESPGSLRVDCEIHPRQARAWIRLAFDDPDKGRVYGRGGRNIHAIRTVLEAVAKTAGQSIYLDIYDAQAGEQRYSSAKSEPRYSSAKNDRGDRSLRDRDSRPRSRDSLGGRPLRDLPRHSPGSRFKPKKGSGDFR